jgi:hypothetical protein
MESATLKTSRDVAAATIHAASTIDPGAPITVAAVAPAPIAEA